MKKRGIILVLVLAVLIIGLFAGVALADEKIYDKDVEDYKKFTIHEVNYTPLYYPDRGQLWLKVEYPDEEEGNIIIENCTDIGYTEYCISDYEEDYDDVYGETFSRVRLKIEEWAPDIDVSRKYSDKTPQLDDEITVTVTIKNDGREGAKIYYNDKIPKSVRILGGDVDRTTNTYRWSDFIDGNTERTFSYRIRPTEVVDYTNQAWIDYEFDGESFTKYSGKDTLKVEIPYEMNIEIEPERVSVGEEVKFTGTLKNIQEEKIEVLSLKIDIPPELEVVDRDGLRYDNTKESFSLYEDEEHKFILDLNTPKKGVHTIWIDLDITYDGKRMTVRESHNISVGISDIKPRFSFGAESYRGCPRIPLMIKLTDGNSMWEVPKVDMQSNLIDDKGWNSLSFKNEKVLVDEVVRAPCSDKVEKYTFSIFGKQLFNGMDFEFSGDDSILVRPLADKLNISHETLWDEKEATVMMKAQNPDGTIWNLTLIDEIDEKEYGPESGVLLKTGEKIEYNYTIKTKEDLNITTRYIYWRGKEMSEWEENLTIKRPKEFQKEETKTEQKAEKKTIQKEETKTGQKAEKKTIQKEETKTGQKEVKKTETKTEEEKSKEESKYGVIGDIIAAIIYWLKT